jgi:hypothetical protein
MSVLNISNNMKRRTFLKNGLWLFGAPYIMRAAVMPSARRIATPAAASGGGVYTAYASVFDGTNDYMKRGGKLTGATKEAQGTFSIFIKVSSVDAGLNLVQNDSSRCQISLQAGGTINLRLRSDADVNIASIYSNNNIIAGLLNTWIHLAATWDGGVPSAAMYINGALQTGTIIKNLGQVDYTSDGEFAICGGWTGSNLFNGEVCELYINNRTWTDLSSNLTLFRTTGNKPAGVLTSVLATSPIVYLKNPYDSFGTNSGTGGNFTVTGVLTQGTPP